MKPNSKQAKGKRLERFICSQIEEAGLGKAIRTPGSGSGKIKSDIFSNLDFTIEAKNWNKIKILDWIDQAKEEAKRGNYYKDKWAVVFNDFRIKPEFTNLYVVIDFWQWLELLKKNSEPRIQQPDRELKWQLQRLKTIINQILKYL